MARRPTIKTPGFIWLPRTDDLQLDIKVNSRSVKYDYIRAEFSRSLNPEIGEFVVDLVNAGGEFTGLFSLGQFVELYLDFVDGTTLRFKGVIDTINNRREDFDVLELGGTHISSELLDINVTASFVGTKTCDEILKEIGGNNLSGYTYTNVDVSTVKPTINWDEKPFWSCVEDLCKLALFDCFVDDDKDFHFFKKGSKVNTAEAAIWNDTLISMSGIGNSSTTLKNKVTVYGEDDNGLLIIRRSQNDSSMGAYGTKELVIRDSNINSGVNASELAYANLLLNKDADTEGKVFCLSLPSLSPGEKIWVSDPVAGITEQLKVFKYTHKFPEQFTDVFIEKKRDIANLFEQNRVKMKDLERVSNPHKMSGSANMVFDDFSEVQTSDSNVVVQNGKISLVTGAEGSVTSKSFVQSSSVSQVQLLIVGEGFGGVTFQVSTDGGVSFQGVQVNELTTLSSPGTDVVVKFVLDASSVIDSLALLMK